MSKVKMYETRGEKVTEMKLWAAHYTITYAYGDKVYSEDVVDDLWWSTTPVGTYAPQQMWSMIKGVPVKIGNMRVNQCIPGETIRPKEK